MPEKTPQSSHKEETLSKKIKEASLQIGEVEVFIRAEIPAGSQLKLTLEIDQDEKRIEKQLILGGEDEAAQPRKAIFQKIIPRLKKFEHEIRSLGWQGVLLALALVLYLATRLFQIGNFPIYFFTDEAVQTVSAADLVRDGFYSNEDEFLPTYFYNGYQYNLSTSVYLQVVPYMLANPTIELTRGTAAITTILAALALGGILLQVFKQQRAWVAVLLFSITPAWFLHSRTAFETGLGVTFYALFLYFYLMYRTSSPKYLYLAILAGALTFYSYSPARVVIALSAVLLFLSDIRYHIRQWKTILPGALLLSLLAVPFIRFTLQHPNASIDHLRVLNSYWIQPIPTGEKISLFLQEYLRGFNPFYWYLPNHTDLDRHLMKGYGHVLWYTFPFMLTGLSLSIKNFRKPAYRTVLLSLLAAPAGAAVAALGITRALIMVIPLALLSALGLLFMLQWLGELSKHLRRWLPLLVFLVLAGVNLFMTYDALKNGPYWYQDYGLGGMQWGAKQIFGEIAEYHGRFPKQEIILSPSWANGTDTIARFFFLEGLPFRMASIEGHFNERLPLEEQSLFIMIPREYELMLESNKFTDIQIEHILAYPNGEPGFYFIHLRYVDDIDKILEAERDARRVLLVSDVEVDGEVWNVNFSYLDMGSIDKIFDDNQDTLMRTMEANPLVVDISFPKPRTIERASIRVGGTPTNVTLEFTGLNGEKVTAFQSVGESPTPRNVDFQWEQSFFATKLHVEILSSQDKEPAHVHLWEIDLSGDH